MVVAEDESIFVYDVKLRRVWAVKGSKPAVLTTGSHRRIAVFGALADNGTQMFRTYPAANSDCFLDYLKQLRRKHPRMILYLDKATYHKKEARVKKYLQDHRDTINIQWFPSGNPEANPVEECWRQGKDEILGSLFHDTYAEFKKTTSEYYRTTRFKLNMRKYLCH